jgi:hypothetical protein
MDGRDMGPQLMVTNQFSLILLLNELDILRSKFILCSIIQSWT